MQTPPKQRKFYQAIPKIELHRHLEGSLRFSTMMEIAAQLNLALPIQDEKAFKKLVSVQPGDPFTSSNFLSKFYTIRKFYRSPEIIQRFTREVIADAASDNVIYMELRFTPVALGVMEKFPLTEVMDWVIEAAYEASEEFGIGVGLIASFNRHESIELAKSVTSAAITRKDKGIVGLDIAGDEANFTAKPFLGVLQEAKEAGLCITVHAGEWGSVDNIIEAIDVLDVPRVGHGVLIFDNEQALALAKERETIFEVCPTSNLHSGAVEDFASHPLKKMLNAGLKVTLNTDDPSISSIDLSKEYQIACEQLGLSIEDLQAIIHTAVDGAWLPTDKRKELLARIKSHFSNL